MVSKADKVLFKANPNRHGWIYLKEVVGDLEEGEYRYYILDTTDDEYRYDDDIIWFEELNVAEFNYRALVNHWASTPNWEAQAEYDAQWGEPLQDYPKPSEY